MFFELLTERGLYDSYKQVRLRSLSIKKPAEAD